MAVWLPDDFNPRSLHHLIYSPEDERKTVCSYLLGPCNTLVATATAFKECRSLCLLCVCVRDKVRQGDRELRLVYVHTHTCVFRSYWARYVCVLVCAHVHAC